MKNYVLVTVVGKTDPIRGMHDGPILHIIRRYHPENVVLILTKEIENEEKEYHYNEDAIHLLCPDCHVESIETGIQNPHSYDDFSIRFLEICNDVKEKYSDKKILLNITSGTPQMETAMCMIAISDSDTYIPVQVSSPERSANKNSFFNPKEDLIEEWFETNLDNEPNIPSRCHIPQLLNFKRPIIQFQIDSLIKNYDYAGAFQLYQENKEIFCKEAGLLLEHAKKRLNLQHNEALALANELGMKKQLYPIERLNIGQLVEYFNSMQIKQIRGEFNDFSMRLEVITEYLALYLMENCMKIKKEEITDRRNVRNSSIFYLSQKKCTAKIPGIKEYLDEQFSDTRQGFFEWGKAINALSIVHIVNFLSRQPAYQRYEQSAKEMLNWVYLSGQVRNPAAHTIVAITDRDIRQSYENKGSAELCRAMKTVLIQIFGNEAKGEGFEIYEKINKWITSSLEKGNEKEKEL